MLPTLREISKSHGQSVLIVSHDERIGEFADRVLWLEDGRVKRERTVVRDPVCGMEIDSSRAPTATLDSVTSYFCSEACRAEFDQRREADDAAGR